MNFFQFIVDALTWCLWCFYDDHEHRWNVRGIIVTIVALLLIVSIRFWFRH